MDSQLGKRLNELLKQNAALKLAETQYLTLEANRKPMLAKLTLGAIGRSHAEREAIAYASQDWADFMAGHVQAESDYQYAKRRYDIFDKSYLAEHATFNRDAKTISRLGGVT